MKFIVDFWMDGFDSEEEMGEAAIEYIRDCLDSSGTTCSAVSEMLETGHCGTTTIYFVATRPAIEKAVDYRIYFSQAEARDALAENVAIDTGMDIKIPWRIFSAEVVNVREVPAQP